MKLKLPFNSAYAHVFIAVYSNVVNFSTVRTLTKSSVGDRKLLEVLGSGASSVQRTQSVPSNPNKGSSDSDEEVIIASTENPKKTVGKAKSPSTLTQ